MFGKLPETAILDKETPLEIEETRFALKKSDGSFLVITNSEALTYSEIKNLVKLTGYELVIIKVKGVFQFIGEEKSYGK